MFYWGSVLPKRLKTSVYSPSIYFCVDMSTNFGSGSQVDSESNPTSGLCSERVPATAVIILSVLLLLAVIFVAVLLFKIR